MTSVPTLRSSLRLAHLPALLTAIALAGSGCAGQGQPGTQLESVSGELSASCSAGATVTGVDVSSYQDPVNWTAAKADGISFAFAKATEGETLVDSTFAANWAGMKSAGVVRGAYHFFHPNESATAQANFFVSTVGALGANDLPLVLDFEVLDGVSEANAVADAVTFLQAVTAATGKTAILYMSAEFLSRTYASLAPYPLWVANYGVSCPGLPSEWSAWSFWQNTDSGTVSGVPGQTDTDVFNGSLSALMAFASGSTATSGSSGSTGTTGSSATSSSSGSTGSTGSTATSSSGSTGSTTSSGSTGSTGTTGTVHTTSCTLDGASYAQNTCTESFQCDNGSWIARSSDPATCDTGVEAHGGCLTDSGTVAVENTCSETLQCANGIWVERSGDSSSCDPGVEANGSCLTDTGTVVAQNTCTSSRQCDNGVWVLRSTDPSACR